jgi:hypothetical protein
MSDDGPLSGEIVECDPPHPATNVALGRRRSALFTDEIAKGNPHSYRV